MFRRMASILAFCTLLCGSATAGPPIARFQSALGDFDVLLDPAAAPVSVANFAAYANRGAYDTTISIAARQATRPVFKLCRAGDSSW